jgi:hypothetical protein
MRSVDSATCCVPISGDWFTGTDDGGLWGAKNPCQLARPRLLCGLLKLGDQPAPDGPAL